MSTAPVLEAAPRKAAVIGAGFGGLALAIRLQSAGIATTVIEARDKPGGRAYFWEKEGYRFDAGPTVITDPDCLRALWELSGSDMERDVELVPVTNAKRAEVLEERKFKGGSDRFNFTYAAERGLVRSSRW